MIARDLASQLMKAATWSPSITVTGPRQSGKTTLCRAMFPDRPYRSLESPDVRAFAMEDPRAFLAQFPDGAVIDEVQRVPDLLSYLQGAIDDDPTPGRWILSGSQNLALIASVSQSLAGRTALHQLLPLSWNEVNRFANCPATLEEAILSGGYPRIFDRELDPSDWLRSYVGTYIERDVRAISNVGDLNAFQRFLGLCAGRTGQLLNYSSLADDCGISQPSAKSWFSILEASFVAFHLPVFGGKVRKRLIKMPKLHFNDSGLACWLLGIRDPEQLVSHPLRGALFETWVVSELLKRRTHRGKTGGLSYYRERGGAELDLVVDDSSGLTLIEAKSATTPSSSLFDSARRVRRQLDDMGMHSEVAVVYGGDESRRNSDGSRLVPWHQVHDQPPDAVDAAEAASGDIVSDASNDAPSRVP
ncbi:MAG: ATP-binding protein [Gammaproteobacteria bacterium]|nr:ATP-binding protein [Gammaproteobacteria bacterium]